MTTKVGLTIAKLAREAEVSVETVRYYHRRGLLNQPSRPETGGYRIYGKADVGRIRFIKHAQQMGFSLAEIGDLLSYSREMNCVATKQLMESKLRAIDEQVASLAQTRDRLRLLMSECNLERRHLCPTVCKFHGSLIGGDEGISDAG